MRVFDKRTGEDVTSKVIKDLEKGYDVLTVSSTDNPVSLKGQWTYWKLQNGEVLYAVGGGLLCLSVMVLTYIGTWLFY
jgi:hypothetical protein